MQGVASDIAATPTALSMPFPAVVVPRTPLGIVTIPRIPILDAQTLNAEVPGAAVVRRFFGDASAATGQVTDDIRTSIASLFKTPQQISNIADATSTFGSEVRSSIARWFVVVTIVLALLVIGWFVESAARIVGQVRRGWAMMLGEPVPEVTLDDLNRQLRAVEDQLASLRGAA